MSRKPLSKEEPSVIFAIRVPASWSPEIKKLKLQARIRKAIQKILEEARDKR